VVSVARARRPPQTIEELLQDLADRVRVLETRRTFNLGGWVLKETTDGRVVLLNRSRGVEYELTGDDDLPAP
jgi:hypothetical protein